MVASIQACCLISSIHAEAADQLEEIPEDEHVHQHPGYKSQQCLAGSLEDVKAQHQGCQGCNNALIESCMQLMEEELLQEYACC